MHSGILAISLLSVAVAAGAHGAEGSQGSAPATGWRSAHETVDSVSVGDTFNIQVRLPESYGTGEKKYPVLYVLDGDKCFGLAADTADWLAWAKEAPELIVVGIGYGEGRDWWQKRSRDLTPTRDASRLWGDWPLAGGATKFQSFLAGELFPLVEDRYRVLAEDRAVAGVSFGGLFGAVSLFTRPALFQRYILVSPALAWDDKRLWQYETDYQARSKELAATVFTAVGSEDEATVREPWEEFSRLIETRHYAGLRWITQLYPEEGHISVLPGALSRGIRRVYEK